MIDRIRPIALIVMIICIGGLIMYADWARGCETSGQTAQSHGQSEQSSSQNVSNSASTRAASNVGNPSQSSPSGEVSEHDGNGAEYVPFDGPTLCEYWPWLFWCPILEGE